MTRVSALSMLIAATGLAALAPGPSLAGYSERFFADQSASEWENGRLRVRMVSVEPGARLDVRDAADRIVIYLTADLEGRMPKAEAIWQPVDAPALENRGGLRATALLVDVKAGPATGAGATPPEALSFTDDVETERLIDNAHVAVTKVRYRTNAYVDIPWHSHSEDALIVYLRGGQAWPQFDGLGAPIYARRGVIDVIPANTHHRMSYAPGDSLEFLVIAPK